MFANIDGRKFFSSSIKGAIRWNDKQTLCKLIEGVNLEEAKDHKGTTLLHMSVRMRVYQMIQFFIENGCDVNARDQTGTTPLLEAVKLYFFTGIKILLDAKANVALSDDKGTNALKFISTCNKIYRTELIALFADHFKKCELDTAELALLMQEAKWPIHYAIYIGNSQLIKLMLETGCDVNSSDEETDYNTALHIAVLYDHIESIQVLLQYGADTDKKNIRNESPFFIALHVPEALETFLDHRNSLLERFNSDEKIEFFEVFSDVACGVIELLLLKYKIDLTTKDSHGNTFLHCVVLNDDQNIVNLLSKTNFDVNIRNNCGDTLLHAVFSYSYGYDFESRVEMLIAKGINVNAQNNDGHTPLTVAINKTAQTKPWEILTENGAILDERMQNLILTKFLENHIENSIMDLILRRIAILNFQGNRISERNLSLIKKISERVWLGLNLPVVNPWEGFLMISEELDKMESKLITVHSNISLFDILSTSEQKLLYYTQNEKIVEEFSKINLEIYYPIFGDEIKTRFELAIVKQNLIQDAIDTLSECIEQLKCNSQVIEMIVKYLSLHDLKRLKSSPSV